MWYCVKGQIVFDTSSLLKLIEEKGYELRLQDLTEEICTMDVYKDGTFLYQKTFTKENLKKDITESEFFKQYPLNWMIHSSIHALAKGLDIKE